MKTATFLLIALMALTSCSTNGGNGNASENDRETAITSVIMERRSIRKYTNRPIDKKLLDQILDCGINAPNGQGRQAYEIRVINSPTLLEEISSAAGSKLFFNAPCMIFIANDTSYDMSQVDCGLLGENIILSAWSHGIGSCCLATPIRKMKTTPACQPFIEKLGFSQGYNLLYGISLGYPDESPSARPRKAHKVSFVE